MAWALNSVSSRASWVVALSNCALATARFARAWSSALLGSRGSIRARSWPGRTSSPVWTRISMMSPDAWDFTSTVRSGWMAPAADAVTTMSRRSTATFSYTGAGCGLLAGGPAGRQDRRQQQSLHGVRSIVTSRSTRPSRRWIWRRACAAMSCSWVTRTIVCPDDQQLLEQLHDLLAGRRVEVAGRLVGEEDAGIVDERPGDRHALALAARQLVGPVIHAVAQPDALERAGRLRAAGLRRRGRRRSAAARRCAATSARGSRLNVWKTNPISLLRIRASSSSERSLTFWPLSQYSPADGRIEAADQVHQGGLARSRRPHDRDELVAPDLDVHAAQRPHHLAAHVVVAREVMGEDHDVRAAAYRRCGTSSVAAAVIASVPRGLRPAPAR